jgi:excisionase family DNA binding protein
MSKIADYLTTAEAARMLGFTPQSVRNLVYRGTLQGVRVGRAVLISRAELRAYQKRTNGMSRNDPRRGKR